MDSNLATKTMRPKTHQVRIEPRQPCPRASPNRVLVPLPNALLRVVVQYEPELYMLWAMAR